MGRQRTIVSTRRPSTAAGLALAAAACAAAVLLALRGRSVAAGAPREPDTTGDECGVSECGADGVPLSAYAG